MPKILNSLDEIDTSLETQLPKLVTQNLAKKNLNRSSEETELVL